MPKPKSAPRSRDRRVTGSGKSVYRRSEDSSSWYANPTKDPTTRLSDTLTAQTVANKNAARDQRRWDATVTSKKVRSNASRARSGKKTK